MRTVQLCVCMVMLLATDLIAQTDTTIKQAAPTLDLHAGLGISLGARFGLRLAPVQPLSVEIGYGIEFSNFFGAGPTVHVYNVLVHWHSRTPAHFVLSLGGGYGSSTKVVNTYGQIFLTAGWYSATRTGIFIYPRIGCYLQKYFVGNDDLNRLRDGVLIDISFGYAFF